MATPEAAAVETKQIPDQLVYVKKAFVLETAPYFKAPPGEVLQYTMDGAPPGFTMDPKTGVIEGIIAHLEVTESFMIGIAGTSEQTGRSGIIVFNLTALAALVIEATESAAYPVEKQFNIWDAAHDWEVGLFLQQLINEHFVYIYAYDANKPPPETSGNFLMARKAKSGWTIRHYEKCVTINPGESAFEQYGNRGRLIATLEELFLSDLAGKGWKKIGLGGSDAENVGKAWIVAKRLNLPVAGNAPTDAAEYNLNNIQRIIETTKVRKIGPTPSSASS